MANETRIQILKELERRAQSQSYMRQAKSGEDGLSPIMTFEYTETRTRYNIEDFLKGYCVGYLETDGYQGNENLKKYQTMLLLVTCSEIFYGCPLKRKAG